MLILSLCWCCCWLPPLLWVSRCSPLEPAPPPSLPTQPVTCRAVLEFLPAPLSASVPDSAQHPKGELSTLAQKQTTEPSRTTFPSPNSETAQFITEKKEKELKKGKS